MRMWQERRQFFLRVARLAGLVALSAAFPVSTIGRPSAYPFRLGVASGSPRPSSIVLWTRLIDDPLTLQAFSTLPVTVQWEVAEDDAFRRIAAKGHATALPALAHSLHVDVGGLRPGRWYWYRFMLGDAVSPIGRTRTAPAADAMPASLRFAFASCQHWEFGQYAAHRHIAAAAPDLVAFLGDYIYEWGPYDLQHPDAPRRRDIESTTLTDYRRRHAQYKSDLHLQAAHRAAPWIVTWDDHEITNDYGNDGGDGDEQADADFIVRRAAAYQAFYEHMPVRLPVLPSGAHRFAFMRLYDRYDWGKLARFHVLDDRQYRSRHACLRPGQRGSSAVTSICAERLDPARTLLGWEQETWLADGLANSHAQWNVIAQQTLMAQATQSPIRKPGDGRFWTDGWDGYPAARDRLFANIARYRPANPVVISGDVHTFYAADLMRDFYRAASPTNPILATEFCGTSVTSSSRPQARTDQFVAMNPHIKFGRSDRRGFTLVELTSTNALVRFQALQDVHREDSAVSTLARFVVEAGHPGVVRA